MFRRKLLMLSLLIAGGFGFVFLGTGGSTTAPVNHTCQENLPVADVEPEAVFQGVFLRSGPAARLAYRPKGVACLDLATEANASLRAALVQKTLEKTGPEYLLTLKQSLLSRNPAVIADALMQGSDALKGAARELARDHSEFRKVLLIYAHYDPSGTDYDVDFNVNWQLNLNVDVNVNVASNYNYYYDAAYNTYYAEQYYEAYAAASIASIPAADTLEFDKWTVQLSRS